MQLLLGRVLRAGTFISIAIVLFGGVVFLYKHGESLPDYRKFKGIPAFLQHLPGLFKSAAHLKGQAIIQLGIILLIATPIMRVMFSAVWVYTGERLYVFRDKYISAAYNFYEYAQRPCRVTVILIAASAGTFLLFFNTGMMLASLYFSIAKPVSKRKCKTLAFSFIYR